MSAAGTLGPGDAPVRSVRSGVLRRTESAFMCVDALVVIVMTAALLAAGFLMWAVHAHQMHPAGFATPAGGGYLARVLLGMISGLVDRVVSSVAVLVIFLVVNYYLAPCVLLSWLALLSMRRGWTWRWALQLAAVVWTAAPLIWLVAVRPSG